MVEITALASGSKGNCYLVTDGVTSLLLECGIPFRDIQRGLNFNLSSVSACLVTHEHKDHCSSVGDIARAGIDCYMSPGTKEAIGLEDYRIKEAANKRQFKVGSWIILPFDVQHDVSEPLGFLLVNQEGEKLLFITDSFYCKYRFSGLTHIMLEVNYCEEILKDNIENGITPKVMRNRLMRSHFSLENAVDFLKANDLSKVQEIWLLHLSDTNSDESKFKREIQELTGKVVKIA